MHRTNHGVLLHTKHGVFFTKILKLKTKMTNFNLEACGLVEMNEQEMTETNGGAWWFVLLCVGIAALVIYKLCTGEAAGEGAGIGGATKN